MFLEKLKNNNYVLYISVIFLAVFRLILGGTIPLFDKTEARYAEIARIMWETNNWVMPHIDYGVPFMAKPPLSTWLSASSYFIFGINEFAARFPEYLINILIIIIVGRIVKKSGLSFYLPGFILLTMPEFLIHTGVVSTDTSFAFCTVMVMLSFWQTMNNEKRTLWNYVFFAALGLGLLAKGPLVIVLTAPPIFIWCVLEKRLLEVWSKFTWIIGIGITALIALPWYYLAEKGTPGFIDYFIIGEHFKRFTEPHWAGDLYGKPKSQPIGMIWVFILIFAFPWIQIVMYKLWKHRKTIFKNSWVTFLLLWVLWTPIFFTMSRNILHTYMLPVAVPIMFLMVHFWEGSENKKIIIRTALFFPFIIVIAYFGPFLFGKFTNQINSDKYLLENLEVNTTNKNIPLYYWKEKNYSGQFYSHGRAQLVKNESQLDSVLLLHKKVFLIISKDEEKEIKTKINSQFHLEQENYKTSVYASK